MTASTTPRPGELYWVCPPETPSDQSPQGTTKVSLKRGDLKKRIEEELLKQEAQRRGCSVPALVRDEILEKTEPPTDEQVCQAAAREPVGTTLAVVRDSLVQERVLQRRREFLKQLRDRAIGRS